MSITLPTATSLLVIDLQAATLRSPFVHDVSSVVSAAAAMTDAFHQQRAPVAFAISTGTPPGQNAYGSKPRVFTEEGRVLAAGLDRRPTDLLVQRARLSAFSGTDLDQQLRARSVSTVVLAGVATSFGVESTARHAYDLGFDVVIAGDAVTDLSAPTHERALSLVFPAIGRVAAFTEIVEALARS